MKVCHSCGQSLALSAFERDEEPEPDLLALLDYRIVPAATKQRKRGDSRLREDTGLGDWSYEETREDCLDG